MSRVVAVAGRRIDGVDADEPRFPLAHVTTVQRRLRELLAAPGISALVCSAACGADLLALEAAGSLGLRRRVVLPFERARFRETSVTDRPGHWGPVFDRVMDEVRAAGDLVVLHGAEDGNAAYAAATDVIFDEALRLATSGPPAILAVVVWDGKPRGQDDLTARFAAEARARGIPVEEITTL